MSSVNNDLNSFLHTEDDLYYFESDHLALKGNKDYCEVLKTIVILTAQREKALKDLSTVMQLKKEALEKPAHFIKKIENKEDLHLPPLVELPKIPAIDFQKFDVKVRDEDLNLIYNNGTNEKIEDEVKQEKNTNKKPWTHEEQKRLEELLLLYPPEPIEMRRFQKIAKALGNRTVQQVCSRIQKYFLKLYKAGLPIPGRIPKSAEKYKKGPLHKHQRHNHYLWKPTTFFPDLSIPVVMNDLDNIPGPSSSAISTSNSSSQNYLLPNDYHQSSSGIKPIKSDMELQLELLTRIKREKLRESESPDSNYVHVGFRCDYCDEEPICGVRWHCCTCTDSIDFCTDCVLSQLYSENCHPLSHKLIVIHDPDSTNSISDTESISNSNKNFDSNSSDCDSVEFRRSAQKNGYNEKLLERIDEELLEKSLIDDDSNDKKNVNQECSDQIQSHIFINDFND